MMIQIAFTYVEEIDNNATLIADTIKVGTIVDLPIDVTNHINSLLKDGQTLKSVDYITELNDFVNTDKSCVPVKECILTVGYTLKTPDRVYKTHSRFRVNTNVKHNLFELVSSHIANPTEIVNVLSVHYSDDIESFDDLTTAGEATVDETTNKQIDLLVNLNVVDYGGETYIISIVIQVNKVTNNAVLEEISKYISDSDNYYRFRNIQNIQIIK